MPTACCRCGRPSSTPTPATTADTIVVPAGTYNLTLPEPGATGGGLEISASRSRPDDQRRRGRRDDH